MTFKSDTFKKSLISKASPVDIHKNLQSPEYINTALLGIYIEHVAIVIYIDDTWHAHTHTHTHTHITWETLISKSTKQICW
jgi:hypothetical protein